MTEPPVRQIVIGNDVVWEGVVELLKARGIELARIPSFTGEEGIENYCLSPQNMGSWRAPDKWAMHLREIQRADDD